MIQERHSFSREKKVKHKKLIIVTSLPLVIAFLFFFYVNDYYHADDEVSRYFNLVGTVDIKEEKEGLFLDGPGEESAFIFYPGAKVEYTSYLPLMYEIAASGIDVFLINMPFNLAFFGINRADDIIEGYDYEDWYIGGHSLGGAMAAYYASREYEKLDGVIFLASYTTKDLRERGLRILSIYGTEDTVLNKEKIEEEKALIPDDAVFYVIDGGNHAYFGLYGEQKGDGKALITPSAQRRETRDEIVSFITANDDR